MSMPTADEVLRYWFAPEPGSGAAPMKRWFSGSEAVDREIREHFGDVLSQAEAGALVHWREAPKSQLALIIVLDQFSRNLYRGSAQAFQNDAQALKLSWQMLEKRWDQTLPPLWRPFVYLPLEHSERLSDQEESLRRFELLLAATPAEQQAFYRNLLDYAQRHHDVIARFGRFPHRNERLGRESTPEEQTFLQEPGSSFG